MKTDTREQMLEYIGKNEPVTIKNISEFFAFSKQIIHIHISKLITESKIYKIWLPPKVYYFTTKDNDISKDNSIFDEEEKNFLEENFVYFSPNWEVKYGEDGFVPWCIKRKLDPNKEFEIYENTLKKYKSFAWEDWFIDGTLKMESTFEEVFLDKTIYLDFYSIEKYWKTLLWNLMLYAKQTNNIELAKKVISIISPKVTKIIKNYKIDSFAFIPPSIDRKVQLMDELKKWLKIPFKELILLKLFKDKPVPQKSLSKREDRIQNAKETIFIWDNGFKSRNILLIDDAVWSWATLNETAKKIKQKNLAEKVYWLAIVWSFKGFEVINEV